MESPSRIERLRRFLPFASLAWGVTSALLMNRSPERAWLVSTAVVLGWAFLALAASLRRNVSPDDPRLNRRLLRYSSVVGTQSLLQLTLFFVLPLFFASAHRTFGHWVFLGLLLAAAASTLWDPLFTRLFSRPAGALTLVALSSFSGLLATLPYLGVGHLMSLRWATFATAMALPLSAFATSPLGARRRAALAGLLGSVVLVLLVFVGAARIVPPAPLRLVDIGLGTQMNRETRTLQGRATVFERRTERLVCFTSISAPLGLSEPMAHVWSVEGREDVHVPLKVEGKAKGGWRTWSTHSVATGNGGSVSCGVQTETGQSLGELTVEVGGE